MIEPNYRALCAELVDAIGSLVGGVKCGHYQQQDMWKCREIFDRANAALAQPEPAVVPVAVSDALIKAECALSDVAEGEPECDDGDLSQWAEQRCAETLAIIRPVMKLHKIRTS